MIVPRVVKCNGCEQGDQERMEVEPFQYVDETGPLFTAPVYTVEDIARSLNRQCRNTYTFAVGRHDEDSGRGTEENAVEPT